MTRVLVTFASGALCAAVASSCVSTEVGTKVDGSAAPALVDGGSLPDTNVPGFPTPDDPAANPEKCLVDDVYAFVSASAAPGGTGSKLRPFRTIGEAIGTTKARVAVCEGTYTERVAIGRPVEIFSRVNCAFTGSGARAQLFAPEGQETAMFVSQVNGFKLVDMEVSGPAKGVPNSIAVVLNAARDVTFVRVSLRGGAGADGGGGVLTPFPGFGVRAGAGGGANGVTAGGGGTTTCPANGDSGGGGGGGGGSGAGAPGGAGLPLVGGGGGGTGTNCGSGGTGKNGDSSSPAPGAPGATSFGKLREVTWTPAEGSKGTVGEHGKGGGGGAGVSGGGGGGGGAGGCGGAGGGGGKGGGASLALLSALSEVKLVESDLRASRAGAGGTGVAGQDGQLGGIQGGGDGGGCGWSRQSRRTRWCRWWRSWRLEHRDRLLRDQADERRQDNVRRPLYERWPARNRRRLPGQRWHRGPRSRGDGAP